MAEVGLVFKTAQGKVGTIEVAATLSEAHSRSADATDHPLEEGADGTDHIRPKPTSLRLEGVVTEQSVDDAWKALERLLDAGEPITVVTSLCQYDNMALISLDAPREAKLGGALRFSASFKSIRMVRTQTVPVTLPRAKPPENKNKGTPTPAPAAVARRSPLKSLSNTVDAGLKKFQESF